MRVMALDAALNHTGYVIHDGSRITEVGVIKVKGSLSTQEKLLEIGARIARLIFRHAVDRVVLEGCYNARNAKTAHQLSMVHGAIMLTAANCGVDVTTIPPATIRKRVAGSGKATKEQVAQAVVGYYANDLTRINVSPQDLDNDITDALATYHADTIEREEQCSKTDTSSMAS